MQRLFSNEITIVMVNQESLDSTRRFFSERKFLYKPKVPFITTDLTLNKMFPNLANPAYAWVDGHGKFHMMTNQLTPESIRSFLAENKVNLDEYLGKQKYLNSLFDKEYESSMISYSYLSKAIPGVNLNGSIGKNGLSFHDYEILDLYRAAFGEKGKHDFSKKWKVQLNVSDLNRFNPPKDIDSNYRWRRENLYNYALLLPKSTVEQKFGIMRSDLERYLSLNARIEKRLLSCLVLVKVGNTDKLISKKTGTSNFIMSDVRSKQIDVVRRFINRPYDAFSKIIGSWIEFRLAMPFVDETGYSGNIDIELNGNTIDKFDLRKIRNQLNKYGLDLIEEKREIDVLIIREKRVMTE